MTYNPYGYVDPLQQAREARESVPQPGISPWPQEPVSPLGTFPGIPQAPGAPWGQAAPPVVSGPLDNFGQSYQQVMAGAAPRGIRHEPMAESWLKGAAIGFASVLVWRGVQRRKATKGEWTSPGFRAIGLLIAFPVIGFLLSTIWVPESPLFIGWGCALGAVSFIAYAVFRACGGGHYNSNRKGSPWHSDHRGSRR